MKLLIIGSQYQISHALQLAVVESNAASDLGVEFEFELEIIDWDLATTEKRDTTQESILVFWQSQLAAKRPDYIVLAATGSELAVVDSEPIEKQHTDYLVFLKALAQASEELDLAVISLSDYSVFDNIKHSPYVETDSAAPFSELGHRAVEMETMLIENLKCCVILRTGWVFSAWGDNHLTRVLEKVRKGDSLVYNSAHQACPTSANDIAQVIIAVLKQLQCGAQCWGIYHYTSSGVVSGYQFAEAVIALSSQYDRQISEEKVALEEKPGVDNEVLLVVPVVLSCQHLLNNFGIKQRPWRDGLKLVIKQFYEQESGAVDSKGIGSQGSDKQGKGGSDNSSKQRIKFNEA